MKLYAFSCDLKDSVARLNQELEDLKTDSEPDEEWIKGTLAEHVIKVVKCYVLQ